MPEVPDHGAAAATLRPEASLLELAGATRPRTNATSTRPTCRPGSRPWGAADAQRVVGSKSPPDRLNFGSVWAARRAPSAGGGRDASSAGR